MSTTSVFLLFNTLLLGVVGFFLRDLHGQFKTWASKTNELHTELTKNATTQKLNHAQTQQELSDLNERIAKLEGFPNLGPPPVFDRPSRPFPPSPQPPRKPEVGEIFMQELFRSLFEQEGSPISNLVHAIFPGGNRPKQGPLGGFASGEEGPDEWEKEETGDEEEELQKGQKFGPNFNFVCPDPNQYSYQTGPDPNLDPGLGSRTGSDLKQG